MSQIRLYLDEDSIKHSLVVALRNSAVDVMTALDANKISCTDEEQLIWATEQGRILYSFNVADFCRLHTTFLAQDRGHAGIVLARQQRYSVGEQLRGLLKLIATKSAEEMRNQLEFLSAYVGTD